METLTCEKCGSRFPVHAKYHAGLSDLGFLYCDRDRTVLTFHAYDPWFEDIVGCTNCVPWQLSEAQQSLVEDALVPCPCGGRFSFKNSLKCPECGNPMAQPMMKDIYYYALDRVIDGEKERVWRKEGPESSHKHTKG